MEKIKSIDGFELRSLLEEERSIVNLNIKLNYNLDLDIDNSKKIIFNNCYFDGADIFFKGYQQIGDSNKFPSISFINCNFNVNQVNLTYLNFETIYFNSTFIKGELCISNSEIKSLSFHRECNIGNLDIFDLKVKTRFEINKKKQI